MDGKVAWWAEDLTGKVGRCSKGIAGYITGSKSLPWPWTWVGFSQETGEPWSSRNPVILDEEPSELALKAAQRAREGG